MKKTVFILSAMIAASALNVAYAQSAKAGADHRSSWAKSQDMYVEPTLKVTENNFVVTPEQAKQSNLKTQTLPAGSTRGNETVVKVYGPDSREISPQRTPTVVPAIPTTKAVPATPAIPATKATLAPNKVQDLSRPAP